MGILGRLWIVGVIAGGLHGLALAEGADAYEEEAWSEAYNAADMIGAINVGDLPPPTAGALDSLPDSALDSAPESAPDASGDASSDRVEEEAKVPAVELYITSWCGYCRQAREFLHTRGIPFVEYDIERDATAARRKQDLNGGPGVPVALINGHVVVGFSDSVYENALRTVR